MTMFIIQLLLLTLIIMKKVNSKGIVELLLYIYKNGLVLLFEKKSENYIYSFNFF